jgi:Leucine-rich repeat (LRR) protein
MTYTGLNASYNYIRVLWNDSLPRGLEDLDVHANEISDDGLLQAWPDTIRTLNLSCNNFYTLAGVLHWPNSLRILNVSYTYLEGTLTALPDTLEELNVSDTNLTNIHRLPAGLVKLDASRTRLISLPYRLPEGLKALKAVECRMKNSGLPQRWGAALENLNLRMNRLRSVPDNLPETLKFLNVQDNFIESVPKPIPAAVDFFNISQNRLFVIPNWLPARPGLRYLIHSNRLVAHPTGPNSLASFGQWVGGRYVQAARVIHRVWKRWRLLRRIRSYSKNAVLKHDILKYVMHPDRIERFEAVAEC